MLRRTGRRLAEVLDSTDIGLLRVRRQVADHHVGDHALAQWGDLLGHDILLLAGLLRRAILADRMMAGDECLATAVHRQGSGKGYCTKPLRGRELADREVINS